MKKCLLLVVPALLWVQFSFAQNVSISGTVKSRQGDLLPLAFVQDRESKRGVYTDSLGSFMLTTNPNAILRVSCVGYRDTLIKVTGNGSITVVLNIAVVITANGNNGDAGAAQMARQELNDRIMYNTPVNGTTNTAPNAGTKPSAPPVPPPGAGGVKSGIIVYPGFSNGKVSWGFFEGMAYEMNSLVPYRPGNSAITQGDAITTFSEKGETQGSRYLFKQWAHGYVVSSVDSLIQNSEFLLNYDKIGGNLLLTKDGRTVIAVYNEKVKSFTLFDEMNQPYTFTIEPSVDKTHYVQVIADGNNYKIYKLVHTQFIKANYVSDGVASSGNNYDEYHDDYGYYLLNVKTGQIQQINLKKKALKQAFTADQAKADGYFKTNDGDVDDNYLASLGDYMNK